MNKYNAIRLLGLFLLLVPVVAFAAITNLTTVTVSAPVDPDNVNQVDVTWDAASSNDTGTDGPLDGYYVELRFTGNGTVIDFQNLSNTTLSTSFTSLYPGVSYDVGVMASFAIAGNQPMINDTGTTNTDVLAPTVIGNLTGVNTMNATHTQLTLADQYNENCTSTDNDVHFVDNCSVDTGFINTSTLGLQSVTYHATDASVNEGTNTVSTTVVDTVSPTLTRNQANPIDILRYHFVIPLNATVTDNDATVHGDIVSCDTTAVNNTAIGSYLATCDFVDPSGNAATQVTYTVNITSGDSPVITLNPPNPQTINLHDPYIELGATASDIEDLDLTGSIVINATGVNVDAIGSYIVTYDVMDSQGNTDHEERTVNVVTGNIPVITIIGDNPANLVYSQFYVDAGATASDIEDLDLTGSIVISGLPIDTFASGTHLVTYTVTDSNGNMASATRTVNVGPMPEGKSCGGDCYHPHFGVDQNGKVFYEDGLRVNNVIYKIDNVLHNHPDKIIELPVGVPVHFALKASDNYASQIRHMELALGIQKGHFDKQQASVIIDLDIDFQGNYIVSYEGDATLVRDVTSKVSILDKTVLWDVTFTPTQHLQHDMFAISVVDEYQYVGTYYINEGITFRGISQNGVPEFTYMDSRGHPHILTIADTTLEDLSVAVDEQGHKWTIDDTTQFWMKEYIRPDMTGSLSKFTGYDRNDYNEFKVYKQGQALIAAQKFDSSKIQGELEATKTYDYLSYERGHNPVPNMIKAYIDYAKSRAGHS